MSFATQEKVAAGFKAAGEQFDVINSELEELKEHGRVIHKQLKQLFQSIHSASGMVSSSTRYGIWATEEQAKTFGACVLAALGTKIKGLGLQDKALGEITDTGGGVLVPQEIQSRLIDLLPKYGKFRANALVLPMDTASAMVPMITSDLSMYVPGEGGSITVDNPEFKGILLRPKTWAALAAVSGELDEDSVIAIGVIVGISAARTMAKNEDLAGFLGDGSSTYYGYTGIVGKFMSISDTISEIAGLNVATGNAYSEITLQDFEDTASLLPSEFDDGAKWYVNKSFYHKVMRKLANASGAANMFEILSPKRERYFLGYPVELVSAMPSTEANSQICAILGDLSMGSYLAQRKDLALQRSEHRYFDQNLVAIRALQRIDVSVFGVGDKTNPGPIVGLITAAS